MRLRLVLAVVGRMLRLFTLGMLGPMAIAVLDGAWRSLAVFAGCGLAGALLGTAMSVGYTRPRLLHRSEAMGIVAGTWMATAVLAAIPFCFYGLSFWDALFESMSGLTTTGATVLVDFTVYDRAFFFWRGLIQWIGGLGVIALFLVILPRLGIAGRQLFFAESSSAPGDAVSPQVRDAAGRLWVFYIALTALCTGALMLTGLGWFDALANTFGTMAAGGFSPNGLSIAGYQNPAAEWVLILFMHLAGASFPLQLKVFTGQDWRGFFKDEEFLVYTAVMMACGVGAAAVNAGGIPGLDALRAGLFQSSSLISSTGFASEDFNLWSDGAKMWLLIAMVVGGCAGSAGGGPKVVRHIITGRLILREIAQTLHPRAVLPIRYNGRGVPDGVMRAVVTLTTLYVGFAFVFGLIYVWMGKDPITAFTASLACIGNIGPGFNEVGPMGNFSGFSDLGTALLTFQMWIGRLEILTVIALLHPHTWRSLRWQDPPPAARASGGPRG